MQALDLPACTCLAIQDSAQALAAARAAGIPTLVTINAYTANDDFPDALCVVDSLGDPALPARQIAGLPLSATQVDLAQLRQWLTNARMANDHEEHNEPSNQANAS